MAEESEQWIADLRKALETNADVATVRNAAHGRILPDDLRSSFWKTCLLGGSGAFSEESGESFANVYDLDEQAEIRAECRRIAEQLCNGEDASDRVFVQSDLESILTQYCKSTKRRFDLRDNWHLILRVVWSVEPKKKVAYRIFVALLSRFLPKDGLATPAWASLFRLLLLYHEPELCNFLDTKQLLPESYAMRWFCSLFASSCDLAVTRSLWDIYVHYDDPFLVFFLALVLLINAKEQILTNRGASKEELVEMIESYAHQVTVDDLEDFCTLALHYAAQTPASYKRLLATQLFRDVPASLAADELSPAAKAGVKKRECRVEELLCLPVLWPDVLDLSTLQLTTASSMQFLFVDCRPEDQYQYSGSLPGATRLNAVLMLQNPSEFSEQVNALLSKLEIVTANEAEEEDGEKQSHMHVCFCSSGFTVEDSYANMLIAHCLQRKVHFVSSAFYGFRALHDAMSVQRSKLEKHDERWCNYCHPPAEPRSASGDAESDAESEESDNHKRSKPVAVAEPSLAAQKTAEMVSTATSLFGRLSGIVKQKIGSKTDQLVSKSAELSQKVAESGLSVLLGTTGKPVTPTLANDQRPSASATTAKSRNRRSAGAAPYRNAGANIFSIADEENEEDEESFDEDDEEASGRRGDNALKREVVNLELWLRNKPDVRYSFPCHILRGNGFLVDAHLLITDSHLFVLRHLSPALSNRSHPASSGPAQMAVIHSRRPLASVVKITSKRKIPELITFQYGVYVDAAEADEEGQVQIVGNDRLLIPKAGDAIRVVKQLIVALTSAAEEAQPAANAAAASASTSSNSDAAGSPPPSTSD